MYRHYYDTILPVEFAFKSHRLKNAKLKAYFKVLFTKNGKVPAQVSPPRKTAEPWLQLKQT